MKFKFYTIIWALLSFGMATAQTGIKDEVVDEELLKNWRVGQTKTIQQQSITKLNDTGDGTTRTNLMFSLPNHDLFIQPYLLALPITVPKSGTVYIFVDRIDSAQVNASNFTIRLFDKSGSKLLFSAIHQESPGKEFKYGVWYNQFGVEIPESAGGEFNVVILDHTTGHEVTYHIKANARVMAGDENNVLKRAD